MSEIIKAVVFDGSTGETIERELNEQELSALSESIALATAENEAQAAKVASRESALAKLAALGLTEDEIAAL